MRLAQSISCRPGEEARLPTALESRPAVFALFFPVAPVSGSASAIAAHEPPPYLSRSRDLRRRLARLLGKSSGKSKLLNLRSITRRIEFQYVGSNFEAQWLLYLLNRQFYPRLYRQRLRLKAPALLKINFRNRFPRCYPTRRLASDGSIYYGPFPSRAAAERFAAEFLDLFKIRRCVEDLHPDPSHPGCIYSQMKMCLAPCFMGCTEEEYRQELSRVVSFLDAAGRPLIGSLRDERERASQALDFESAERAHRKIERVNEVLRSRPDLVRNLDQLQALIVLPGAAPRTVTFFRVAGCELSGPATLLLDENVSSPGPLDQQLDRLAASLSPAAAHQPHAIRGSTAPHVIPSEAGNPLSLRGRPREESASPRESQGAGARSAGSASWEHLALLSRWYYSSYREGDLIMLPPDGALPHRRLIRLCRKILAHGG
jgi:excinuclease ABC subunit C